MSYSDDIRSTIARMHRIQREIDDLARDRAGRCRHFVGQVFQKSTFPTASDRYFAVHPARITGNETENTAASFVVDTSTTVYVDILGPAPAIGDYIIAELVDRTWVADRWSHSAGTSIGVNIPGCICQGTPQTLELTLTFGSGENPRTYGNAYQPATLAYYSAGPLPYQPIGVFPGPGYYSTTTWIDDYGFQDYYRLVCFASQYSLAFGQYGGGLWSSPGQLYNWGMSAKVDGAFVNFCSPFLLAVGATQPNIFFNGKFFVSG